MKKQNIKSGTQWEEELGYCRVVRRGPLVEVAGTVAADETGVLHHGSAYEQSKYIFDKIAHYLGTVDASIHDVVRTRIYVSDVSRWPMIARAHHEMFSDICPVSTLVEVSRFVDPKILVEIEVTAYVSS